MAMATLCRKNRLAGSTPAALLFSLFKNSALNNIASSSSSSSSSSSFSSMRWIASYTLPSTRLGPVSSVSSTKISISIAKPLCTVALDPDFYKIPHVMGIPKGSKLKLFNLPPTEDREKLKNDLIEWFVTCEEQEEPVKVMNFEYTDDPEWNSQGVGAFVEFGSKMQAVTVYARRDAAKFQGRYVRMDFVERDPFPPEWLAKNAKWFRDDSSRSNAKIFVGNLSWSVDDAKLQNLFAAHGTVYDAKVMTDRETGRSRGFGFVTMSNEEEMKKAVEALNGSPLDGRPLRVNEASQKPTASASQ